MRFLSSRGNKVTGKYPEIKIKRMIHATLSLWNRVKWSLKDGDLHNGYDYSEIVCECCGSVIGVE